MKRLIYALTLLFGVAAASYAQDTHEAVADTTTTVATPTIADHINATDRATVTQPDKLNRRLARKVKHEESASATRAAGGYRIQFFSGNNARTAKRDADNRAAAFTERYPEYGTYVTFDAPYWRLRVGDFVTYEDAAAALTEFKRAFPSFAREMRLVRDRINIHE